MAQLLLDTTRSAGLRPLGAPGQRSFELIVPAVARALGPEHAALFAEPVPNPRGDSTDWYATVHGTARRFEQLDPAEQKQSRDRLGALSAGIYALADRLGAASDEESQRLGQALRNALEIPDESAIFVVGDQPVLVSWAHRRDVAEAPHGLLQAMVPAAPLAARAAPLMATAEHTAPTGAPGAPVSIDAAGRPAPDWLWYLTVALTGLILAAVLWLLIAPCGLAGPSWFNFCPAPAELSSISPELEARRIQLEAEIAAMERAALAAERQCKPSAQAAPDGVDIRRRAAGGQLGELTVTLVWGSTVDIDLHLTCPGGQTIFFRNKSDCGGRLDLDANGNRQRTSQPIENVFFASSAPAGRYIIRVNLYDRARLVRSQAFTVQVQMGDAKQTYRGSVSSGQPDWTQTFEYGG